jgi:hypothetical protein
MVTKSSTNQRTPQILKAAYISHKIALSMMNVFHISPQVTHFLLPKDSDFNLSILMHKVREEL